MEQADIILKESLENVLNNEINRPQNSQHEEKNSYLYTLLTYDKKKIFISTSTVLALGLIYTIFRRN